MPTRFTAGSLMSLAIGVIVAVASLAACGSTPSPTVNLPVEATPSGPAGPIATGAAAHSPQAPAAADVAGDETLIRAADGANLATLDALTKVRFTQAGARAAADVLAGGGSPDVVWAALWVYGSSGDDAAVAARQLNNPDPADAALAAGVSTSLGSRDGLSALRKVLDEEGQMRNAEPPESLQAYAIETLTDVIAPTSAPDITQAADDAAAAGVFAAWLDANSAQLQFDPASGTWTSP